MELTDIKTKILVMAPVAFAIILLSFANTIEFEDGLSSFERQALNFEYRRLNIQEKEVVVLVKRLKGPLYPDPLDPDNFSGGAEIAEEPPRPEVSIISISGNSKMAIIQGILVKEGDIFNDARVVKIESERVLLKNGKNKWIYIKK